MSRWKRYEVYRKHSNFTLAIYLGVFPIQLVQLMRLENITELEVIQSQGRWDVGAWGEPPTTHHRPGTSISINTTGLSRYSIYFLVLI
jgi:hypothetical protein